MDKQQKHIILKWNIAHEKVTVLFHTIKNMYNSMIRYCFVMFWLCQYWHRWHHVWIDDSLSLVSQQSCVCLLPPSWISAVQRQYTHFLHQMSYGGRVGHLYGEWHQVEEHSYMNYTYINKQCKNVQIWLLSKKFLLRHDEIWFVMEANYIVKMHF